MTITRGGFVVYDPVYTTAHTSGAMSADPVAGSGIVVMGALQPDAGTAVSTVTDSAGNTYTAVTLPSVSNPSDAFFPFCYVAKNIGGTLTGLTITVTSNGDCSVGFAAREVKGMDTTSPNGINTAQAQTAPGAGANAVTSGSAGTPGQDGHFVMAMSQCSAGIVYTAGTGFTHLRAQVTFDGFDYEDVIQTTATAVAGTFTVDDGSGGFVVSVATFKAAGGGSPVTLTPTGSEGSAESGTPAVLFTPGIIYKIRF